MENEQKFSNEGEPTEMNGETVECPENEQAASSETGSKVDLSQVMDEERLKKIKMMDAAYLRKEQMRVQKEEEERQQKMKDNPKQRYLLAVALLIVLLLSIFLHYKNGDVKSILGKASNNVAPVTASVEVDTDILI